MQEVQAVCSRIIIINEGKIVADGSTEELQSAFQNKTKLVLELMAPENEIPEISEKLNEINILSISPLSETTFCVEVEFDVAKDVRAEVFDFIKTKDWKILEMHRQNISLEAVFRSLTIEGGEK